MTSYEIFLLAGGLAGVLAICALASVFLDRGSVRIMAFLAVVTGGCLYLADGYSDEGLNFYDIPPAINKVIGMFSS